jgi:hypothetical protein
LEELKQLDMLEQTLDGLVGAITAFRVCPSKASSLVIREQLQEVEKLRVGVRKELVEFDKTLGMVKPEQ